MNVKINGFIAKGATSNVYLGSVGGKKCIIKQSAVLEDRILFTLYELTEFDKFAKRHEDFLLRLISHSILPDYNDKKLNICKSRKSAKYTFSGYCQQSIYTPVLDGSLRDIYDEMNELISADFTKHKHVLKKQRISILAQIFYMWREMAAEGWYHTDVHLDNIMFCRVNRDICGDHRCVRSSGCSSVCNNSNDSNNSNNIRKTSAKENPAGIKYHGLNLYIIDYHMSLFNENWESEFPKNRVFKTFRKNKHKWLAYHVLNSMYQPFWEGFDTRKIQREDMISNQLLKLVPAIKDHLPALREPITINICVATLALLLAPKVFIEAIGANPKYLNEMSKQPIDTELYLWVIRNLDDVDKVVQRLATE